MFPELGGADIRRGDPGLDILQLEFQAQEELVTIVPKFCMEQTDFFSGTYGPLQPGDEVDVPLWMALLLRRCGQCTVKAPPWMDHEKLEAVLQVERDSGDFQPVPQHYLEVAKMLLSGASRRDFDDPTKIQRLVAEIDECRAVKMQRGIGVIADEIAEHGTAPYRMAGVTPMEVVAHGSSLTRIISLANKLANPAPPVVSLPHPLGAPAARVDAAPAAPAAAPPTADAADLEPADAAAAPRQPAPKRRRGGVRAR
eukprot:Hpha_TRINITY_DN13367_c0_g1::TRINITY_DN13367_c0_g1_i1::g.95366::m.95366/K10733/GINS2, PSF2; GINS complex subunit 2